jgi:uncharacterized protein YdcH (DUF465 family)
MERSDRELIEQMMKNDMRLKRLYDQHAKLEQMLERFQGRVFLTSAEQREERDLKKKKLSGVDEMMRLLEEQRARGRPEEAHQQAA